jgi:hypothetical protein
MGASARISGPEQMASRWRRRRMCVLVAEAPAPAGLRHVSAMGAFLETNARPALGSTIELRHPEAGNIEGVVKAFARDGIRIGFECGVESVAFALAAITADMSRSA